MALPVFRTVASSATDPDATTLAVNVPASTVDGDLLITTITVFSNRTVTPPAGWTLVRDDTNATVFLKVQTYLRIASSEPASYTWTIDLARPIVLVCTRYDGHYAVTPIEQQNGQANTTDSTSATAPSITTGTDDCLLYGVFATTSSIVETFTPATGMTERADLGNGSTATGSPISVEVATEDFATKGATGTRVATISNAKKSICQLFAIASVAPSTDNDRGVGRGISRGISRGIR